MSGGITKAVFDGVQVSITANCWPCRRPIEHIRVSATKHTWKGVVTLIKKIRVANKTTEQIDEEIVHAVLEVAGTIDQPHNWKG